MRSLRASDAPGGRACAPEPLEARLALSADPAAAATTADSPFAMYASAVYKDVLQRQIDPSALAYWTSLLDSGLPVQAVAGAVAHSDEYDANIVIGPDFQRYLQRGASASDIAFYTAAMQSGASDEQIEAVLVASDEFFNDAGGTNAAWIDAVYNAVLGRAADPGGSAFWLAELAQGQARTQVAMAFTSGAERESARIEADFSQVLHESSDGAVTAYWAALLGQGMTNESIVAYMAGTDDYFQAAAGQPVTTVPQPADNSWFAADNAAIDATAAQNNAQVMFLGDSLTYGWTVFGNDAWNQYFGQFQPLDAGIPGDTTQNILWRLDNGLLDNVHPKLVVLLAGTNNLLNDSSADIAAGVKAIVDTLHERLPDTKVLLVGIPPTGTSASYPYRQKEAAANALIQALADGVDTFYIDITPLLLAPNGDQQAGIFFDDQVHLTAAGYQIYAQAIGPLVERLMEL
ncbi:MAG TPA: GDSL-type esterase/lipase family protein [Pirellulales bacterium]|nr:GDSL-type esterase/lipase family protein [Pirellulales bacterium]